MSFDFALAIAKLEGEPNLDALRGRYPELSFVFDELENLREDQSDMVKKSELTFAEGQIERLQDNLDDCASRFAQIRDLADTLAKFDGGHAVRAELRTISSKADDGAMWAEKAAAL